VISEPEVDQRKAALFRPANRKTQEFDKGVSCKLVSSGERNRTPAKGSTSGPGTQLPAKESQS